MWYHRKSAWLAVLLLACVAIWGFVSTKTKKAQFGSADNSKYDYARAILTKLARSGADVSTTKCGTGYGRVFKDVFSALTSSYRACLMERLKGKPIWNELGKAIEICLGDALWRLLDAKKFENRDDVKLAILPPSDIPAVGDFANCTEITLGVGRDIEAELLLRKVQPHCKFYGADPIESSGKVFEELGPYFELAVAGKGGLLNASVMENGQYMVKTVSAVTLVDFLTHYVNSTKVDYVLMDNEGAEYQIFKQLLAGGVVEASNISICQISVEMHESWKEYGLNETGYNQLIYGIVSTSSFLPIWSDISGHTRSFYINVADPYCVGKYFRSKWCGDFQYYT